MKRQEAIRILDEVIPPPEHHTVDLDHLRIAQAWLCIKETLTAEPVKHGQWIFDDVDNYLYDTYRCSICGKYFTVDSKRRDDIGFTIEDLRYCPNCGAIMDEAQP